MTEMSFLNSEVLAGDLMSPFDQSGLGAEESLGLLDDYLEVAKHLKPHGFSSDKAGSSEWPAMDDGLASASDTGKEDAFSGTDWMLEKMDLKEFDFDALFRMDDLETMPDELLTTLDDTCDLFAPLVQETNKEPPQTVNPIDHLPESLIKVDQVAPFTFLQPFPCSPGVLSSTPEHSFSLELGSEVDISEGDRKPDSAAYITLIPPCVKEEDTPSDNDSGICMSPESYLGSPQHSPSTSRAPPDNLPSPGGSRGSPRPKPYDPPGVSLTAKVKTEKLDKKLKKMEQNKTAATRYRQKKRAEQEALTGECKELENKEPPQTVNPIGHLPESLIKVDQVAPFTFLQPFPCSPGVLSSTPEHSFSLELGSEVDISEGDRKPDSAAYITLIPPCVKEEDTPSDNDSGICMSPESYLGSPQHSPSTSRAPPDSLAKEIQYLKDLIEEVRKARGKKRVP